MKGRTVQTLEFDIEGMTCNGCVGSVTRVLTAVPGVEGVEVTLQPPHAKVAFDERRADRAKLVAAIEDAGYGVAA